MDQTQILNQIATALGSEQGVQVSKWFGMPCLKVDGKVFAALSAGDMVFKLDGEAHAEALQVEGSHLFDPRGTGRPLRAWVQVPRADSSTWGHFARLACDTVAGAAQAQKDAIIAGLVEARSKILAEVRALPTGEQDRVFLGTWSVKDLLAHLVGWDVTNLEAVGEILAGQKPSFFQYHDPDWQSYNARLVTEHKRDDLAEMVASVEASHHRLIDFLQSVPADEYVKKKKIGTLLRAEARDEEEHCRQLRTFRQQKL
ncbi:MAG: ClbS/DfsB family four-helix bundle protein [Anaerolineae bacterium]|nr:ClbS/DfsB family four-helix bundle protein [Anaerolineae bacterium]